MKYSPTVCQRYVAKALRPVRALFPSGYCYHYMDDILLVAATPQELGEMENKAHESLNQYGLVVAPQEVQQQHPWLYLGMKILDQTRTSQPTKLQVKIKTLNDVQNLAGVINWVRPYVGIPSSQLQPLFDLWRGVTTISAP